MGQRGRGVTEVDCPHWKEVGMEFESALEVYGLE